MSANHRKLVLFFLSGNILFLELSIALQVISIENKLRVENVIVFEASHELNEPAPHCGLLFQTHLLCLWIMLEL